MQYRRARVEGGTYFFTVVTFERRRILCEGENAAVLREAFRTVIRRHPFVIDAIAVLPDHLHCVWSLPADDRDFSTRWRLIKSCFSRECEPRGADRFVCSRAKTKETTVWQRRYWEHLIRDERDFAAHCDYIHYNPVKHGLVAAPKDWPHTSFHRCVRVGLYDANWGAGEEVVLGEGVGRE